MNSMRTVSQERSEVAKPRGAKAERPLPPCDTMHRNAQTGNAASEAARSAASVALAFVVALYRLFMRSGKGRFFGPTLDAARRRGARGKGERSECDAGQGGTTQPGPGGPRDREARRRHASTARKARGTQSGPTRWRRADKPEALCDALGAKRRREAHTERAEHLV